MAFEHFIPTIWSEGINRELAPRCVFVEDCNRQYEGEAKEKGDTVRILGVGKPTIREMARRNASGNIEDPEELEDSSVSLVMDQIRYYNYMVGDIDAYQAKGNIMEALNAETSEGLACSMDKYIAKFAVDTSIKKMHATAQKVVKSDAPGEGERYVLDILDDAIQIMQERNIMSDLVLTASPRFIKLLRQAYIIRDTDNSLMLKNGKVGTYGNVTLKISNNVERTEDGTVDNIMLRTKRAIAFAHPFTKVKAYEPEKKFADAIKGFILFGGKIVRPNEILNINVRY